MKRKTRGNISAGVADSAFDDYLDSIETAVSLKPARTAVSKYSSIDALDAWCWNQLAGTNGFATHGWLKTVEVSCRVPIEPIYFVVEHDGKLLAGAACYVCPPTGELETIDDILFGRIKNAACRAGVTTLPALVCGPLLGYGWHFGVDRALTARQVGETLEQLLDAIEAEADRRRLTVAFAHVVNDERLHERLARRGYLACQNVPVAVLDINWRSFEEYMATFPRRRRTEFRRQSNRHREGNSVVMRLRTARGVENRLLELVDGNARKHNGRPHACGAEFFTTLERQLRDGARLFATKKAGLISAVIVLLVREDVGFAAVVGVDDRIAGDDYSYFELTYNTLIQHAIESGLTRLYYGRGMCVVKVRRGCSLTDTWTYVRPVGSRRTALALWVKLASAWNRQKVSKEIRRSRAR